jgi:hypothetical protein
MKKAILLLGFVLLISGTSFASFHVAKTQKEVKPSSTAVVNEAAINEKVTTDGNIDQFSTSAVEAETKGKAKGDDRTVAIILALVSVLVLPFGLHNWYLGRKKQALWQTLMVVPGFILLGLPALASWIWQIVDLIRLLSGGLM